MEDDEDLDLHPFPKPDTELPDTARSLLVVLARYFDWAYARVDGDHVWIGDTHRCFDMAKLAGAAELAAWTGHSCFHVRATPPHLLCQLTAAGRPPSSPNVGVLMAGEFRPSPKWPKPSRIVSWEDVPNNEAVIMAVTKDGTRVLFARQVLQPALELFEDAHLVARGPERPVVLVAADKAPIGVVMPVRQADVG